jgi:ankyrin repeat protein
MKRRWKLLSGTVLVILVGYVGLIYYTTYRQHRRDEALLQAIRIGRTDYALRLLDEGANPDHRESAGSQPNLLRDLLDWLLRRKKPTPQKGHTALLLAAEHKQPRIVKALLDYGAKKLEAVNHDQATVILLEARNRHWDNVENLVRRGANPRGLRFSGFPLQEAVSHGAPLATIRMLLNAGADPNHEVAIPLLTVAASERRLDVVRLLIRAGADLEGQGHGFGSGSPLVGAISAPPGPLKVDKERRFEAVRLLLQSGADPKETGYRDETPFAAAAEMNDYPMMRLLLEAGATPNVGLIYGSPLMGAAYAGDLRMMRFLIATGADVNLTRSKWGESAIDDAASNGQIEAIRLLLHHGAKVESELPDRYGSNPIREARQNGHLNAVQVLKGSTKLP